MCFNSVADSSHLHLQDSGVDGLFDFSIASNGNPGGIFAINPLSGAITLNGALNFETASSYTLLVTATDRGSPARSSAVTVSVTVTDVNDNTPLFGAGSYHANLFADLTAGSIVSEPSATDADGSSPNNAIVYSLIPVSPSTNTKFVIIEPDWRQCV